MAIVTIFHNNHPSLARHRGYQPEDAVTQVFTYDLGDSGDDLETMHEVHAVMEADHHNELDCPVLTAEAAMAYRARRNRPIDTGDVVQITHADPLGDTDAGSTYYAGTLNGWEEIATAPVVLAHRSPGTTPETETALDVLMTEPQLDRGREPGLVTLTTGTHTITMFSVRTIGYVTDNATGERVADIDGDVAGVAEAVLLWNAKYQGNPS